MLRARSRARRRRLWTDVRWIEAVRCARYAIGPSPIVALSVAVSMIVTTRNWCSAKHRVHGKQIGLLPALLAGGKAAARSDRLSGWASQPAAPRSPRAEAVAHRFGAAIGCTEQHDRLVQEGAGTIVPVRR